MDNWVMTLFLVRPKLKLMEKAIDKQIDAIAANPVKKTEDAFNEIMELVGRKSQIANLKVLFDDVAKKLTKEERTFVLGLILMKSYNQMALETNSSRTSRVRIKNKVMTKAREVLIKNGYDAEHFKNEYKNFYIVMSTYKKVNAYFESQKIKRKEDARS